MKKILILLLAVLWLGFGSSSASATAVLYNWAFNIDGTVTAAQADYDLSGMPVVGALNTEGLGTLFWSTSEVGDHSFISFFDYEIDEPINTYFNEYGNVSGALAMGQSWEIDIPWGYSFGDIYYSVDTGALDNSNGVPSDCEDDVSMAMGWDFTLGDGETAEILLTLGNAAPAFGFYLSQTDPDSDETIYFSSTLDIQGGGTGPAPVPEPATLLLLGSGIAGLIGIRKKKFLSKS